MTGFAMKESIHDRHLFVLLYHQNVVPSFFLLANPEQAPCLGQAFSVVPHVLASTFFQFLSTAFSPCSIPTNQTNSLQLILACAIPVFQLLLRVLTIRPASRPSNPPRKRSSALVTLGNFSLKQRFLSYNYLVICQFLPLDRELSKGSNMFCALLLC